MSLISCSFQSVPCINCIQELCPFWEGDIVDNIFTVIEDVMADIFGSVNDRMVLVGQNRLELLIFKLATDQIFGINVFKVREVLKCPLFYIHL